MKKLRVLLTGGGTGGHIFPLIAVANELQKQTNNFGISLDLRYFGSARKYAREIVENDIEFVPILSGKWRRYWSLLNLLDIFKFFLSFPQLLWKIFWFMPEVTFSKGGPGALAAILISRFYRIPLVIHESDSLPGLTNKISAGFSEKILVAFASAMANFRNKNIEVIGNPVRGSLFANLTSLKSSGRDEQTQAKREFGLNPNEPVILVLGGSQGAERINNFVLENLAILIQNFQVLHQVGWGNYDSYKKEFEFITKDWNEAEKNRYIFHPFFDKDLGDALISADLAISRAGAGSIFELAAFGRPAMLVPLPESANDHQKENARLYAETGAAIVIQEENLLGNLVAEELQKLIANPELLRKMSDAAKSFYRPDAAAIIAKYLLTYVR